ncbi:MAG: hypothetical protein WC124_02050 [Desulfoplanes sp.]
MLIQRKNKFFDKVELSKIAAWNISLAVGNMFSDPPATFDELFGRQPMSEEEAAIESAAKGLKPPD